ncbi:hypothetical protein B7R21_19280 [Subtercola boreus]|uniref:ABC3 transporter permease C-terminal domain-containing protein n=1 Tax=Subtercola boreus TaxID=120213 RepID=A0A3E0VCK4_9MICO|nr:FtsX-like permease family protein [Subtercola boreus]RFA06627.1 hypothetical protein B7R21_19280 [Subtercola boreus]
MRLWALRALRESANGYAASVAAVAVVAAFAVLLLESIEVFTRALTLSGMSEFALVQVGLTAVGLVFFGISAFTAAIVISGTFATTYASRLNDIALLRLIGATSRQVRRASRVDGLAVGIAGTVIGIALGIAVSAGAIFIVNSIFGAGLSFAWVWQIILVPAVACVGISLVSASAGAKRISTVSPAGATRYRAESTRQHAAETRLRRLWMIAMISAGGGLLALGFTAGTVSPLGLLIAFPGGVLTIVGIVVGAHTIAAPIVELLTRRLPRGGQYALAGANLRTETVRASRTIISVLIGVTLITMFTVAGNMFLEQVRGYVGDTEASESAAQIVTVMLAVVYTLTAFSVLVAIIGIGSNLTLSVIQRRQEIGMLRSLGMTVRQVRGMILTESVIVTIIGAVLGIILGTLYGFVGANATLGVQGVTGPVIPPTFVIAVLGGAIIFAALASIVPGRSASRIPPAEALRQI